MFQLYRRDSTSLGDSNMGYGPPFFLFIALLFFTCSGIAALIYLRRRRNSALQYATLPTHHRGHHRNLTIATHPANLQGNSIFVYDEKMHLIANSNSPPSSPVPEIHVTFPDEEGQTGDKKSGGVFVLCISDSGSVGMKPLYQEALPPYQSSDAERFQSLDLERIGGLREKPSTSSVQRWS